MNSNHIIFKNEKQLCDHIKTHKPTFYFSSQTSTVIPYDKLDKIFKTQDLNFGDLSQLPKKMEINDSGNLIIRGAVSWKEAREFLRDKGYNIMTSPTEELALVLAGVATSCTGERCFSFGNLRSQINSIKYFDYQGNEKSLNNIELAHDSSTLKAYQEEFNFYANYKNAPYPRFEKEIDLMIGSEGQLGIISEVELKIVEDFQLNHLFILLPKWEEDFKPHLEISNLIQNFRKEVLLCEFIDHNSFNYLPKEDRPNQGCDAIFFEILASQFDHFYENFIQKLKLTYEDNIFELSEVKFHQMRANVPRAVFEQNSRMGVNKVGTDIQVPTDQFENLLNLYRDLASKGIEYNLFGHFGDSHLHFNFMPTPNDLEKALGYFENLYTQSIALKASPFAEHGIGFLKQKYIKQFWRETQPQFFRELKQIHDPHNQFFPDGFMSLQ